MRNPAAAERTCLPCRRQETAQVNVALAAQLAAAQEQLEAERLKSERRVARLKKELKVVQEGKTPVAQRQALEPSAMNRQFAGLTMEGGGGSGGGENRCGLAWCSGRSAHGLQPPQALGARSLTAASPSLPIHRLPTAAPLPLSCLLPRQAWQPRLVTTAALASRVLGAPSRSCTEGGGGSCVT